MHITRREWIACGFMVLGWLMFWAARIQAEDIAVAASFAVLSMSCFVISIGCITPIFLNLIKEVRRKK